MIRTYRNAIEDELRDPVESGMVQGERLSEMLLGPVREDLAGTHSGWSWCRTVRFTR